MFESFAQKRIYAMKCRSVTLLLCLFSARVIMQETALQKQAWHRRPRRKCVLAAWRKSLLTLQNCTEVLQEEAHIWTFHAFCFWLVKGEKPVGHLNNLTFNPKCIFKTVWSSTVNVQWYCSFKKILTHPEHLCYSFAFLIDISHSTVVSNRLLCRSLWQWLNNEMN